MINPNNVQPQLWELCRTMLLEALKYQRQAKAIVPDTAERISWRGMLLARSGTLRYDAARFLIWLRAETR